MTDWPHSPVHRLGEAGAYMVTAGTYQKQPHFRTAERLTFLCASLLRLAARHQWELQAWAVFPNHYHFIALSPANAETLRNFVRQLHAETAIEINRKDQAAGRRVWFEYWDSHITFPRAFLARLNYVHGNAVKHGLVREPSRYPWCSAGWFERNAPRPFYRTVMEFPSDRVKVRDDFTVDAADVE